MIKVKETKLHNVHLKGKKPFDQWDDVPVAEGKLVLVKAEGDALLAFNQYNGEYYLIPNKGNRLKMPCFYLKPIIISETEKIEETEFYYDTKQETIRYGSNNNVAGGYKKRILVLPEQFSPEQLNDIVDGRFKDGDKILVECEQMWKKVLTKVIHSYSTQSNCPDGYKIKLNSQGHVTLYKSEEKTISYDLALQLVNKMRMKCLGITPMSEEDEKIPKGVIEWFEQNVK